MGGGFAYCPRMGIELRQLRYFVAVVEEGSITRAAGQLFLSQQALSAAIRQLEQRAGTELLVRGPRGLEVTDAGRTLLAHARRVLRGADELEAAVRAHPDGRAGALRGGLLTDGAGPLTAPNVAAVRAAPPRVPVGVRTLQPRPRVEPRQDRRRDGRDGSLRVGLLTDGAGPLTAPIVAAFRAARPRVQVGVRTLQPGDGVEPLLDGRVDVALLHGPQPDDRVDLLPLFTEPRVVAVAADSPLADAPSLAPAALVDQRVATRNPAVPASWEGFFTLRDERDGEEPERVGEAAATFDEVLWNIALNDVVLTLPAHVATARPGPWFGVTYVPVPDLAPVVFGLAARRHAASPLVATFLAVAQEVTRRLIELVPGGRLPEEEDA